MRAATHAVLTCRTRKRKREGDQPQRTLVPPQNPNMKPAGAGAALGLGTPPDACALWDRRGCETLSAVDKALRALAVALVHAMGATSAARLAVLVTADAGCCLAALTALNQVHCSLFVVEIFFETNKQLGSRVAYIACLRAVSARF